MSLRAGRLRHRVNIERRVNSQDSVTGEVTVNWQLLHEKVAANIEPLSVREFIAAGSIQSQVTARITIRYRAGLTADMRIVHNGNIYNPEGWLPDLDSGLEFLTAPVSLGVNEG